MQAILSLHPSHLAARHQGWNAYIVEPSVADRAEETRSPAVHIAIDGHAAAVPVGIDRLEDQIAGNRPRNVARWCRKFPVTSFAPVVATPAITDTIGSDTASKE